MNRYQVHRRGGARPYKIVAPKPGGGTRTIGSSKTLLKAKQSAGIAQSRGE